MGRHIFQSHGVSVGIYHGELVSLETCSVGFGASLGSSSPSSQERAAPKAAPKAVRRLKGYQEDAVEQIERN